MNYEIIQITAAHDWFAIYKTNSGRKPVVCWALIKDDLGTTAIIAMVANQNGQIDRALDDKDFLRLEKRG